MARPGSRGGWWIALVMSLAFKQAWALVSFSTRPFHLQTTIWMTAVALLFASAPFLLPLWLRKPGILLVALGVSVLVTIDLGYYRAVRSILPLRLVSPAHFQPLGLALFATVLRPGDIFLWIDAPYWIRLIFRPAPASFPPRGVAVATMAAAALTLVVVGRADPVWKNAERPGVVTAERIGVVGYHLLGLANSARHRWSPDVGVVEAVQSVQHRVSDARPGQQLATRQPQAVGANLLVIQVESLQTSILGRSLAGQPITPFLDSLSSSAIVFTNYYSQVGIGRTSDAELLSECSLPPAPDEPLFDDEAFPEVDCLPMRARRAGYRTEAFHGNHAAFYNRQLVYPRLGYQRFWSYEGLDHTAAGSFGVLDSSVFEQAARRIEALPQPFYVKVVTLSSHVPFLDPPPVLTLGDLGDTSLGHYLNAVRYADDSLRTFLGELGKAGVLANTVVAIYGDHVGVHYDEPELERVDADEPTDPLMRFDFEHRVPLYLLVPGAAPRHIDALGGQIDLAPTLADILGIPIGTAPFLGRNLFAAEERPIFFPTGAVLTADRYFDADLVSGGSCYNRHSHELVSRADCDAFRRDSITFSNDLRIVYAQDRVAALEPVP